MGIQTSALPEKIATYTPNNTAKQLQQLEMPYRVLCKRSLCQMTQSALVLGSEKFGNEPLHKIRYGVQLEKIYDEKGLKDCGILDQEFGQGKGRK
jgi:hypothetical protein